MALSAVVLPAPFGPMSPRMRPSSTRRLIPSSATDDPNAFRRPRASMHAMVSTLLFGGIGLDDVRIHDFRRLRRWGIRRHPACFWIQQFFRRQPETLNRGVQPRPFFAQKLLPFALQQQTPCPNVDEHTESPSALDQPFVDQLLVALQNRKRIHPILRRHRSHGGQRIAFLEHAVEYHRDHAVAKLAVNRLTVVPLAFHPVSLIDATISLALDCRFLFGPQVANVNRHAAETSYFLRQGFFASFCSPAFVS